MKVQKYKFLILISLLAIFFFSCSGSKGSVNPSKYVQVFYTESGSSQYFVKPIEYECKTGELLKIDFTLNDSINEPPVRMLLSVSSKNPLTSHSKCKVGITSNTTEAKKIYAEPTKDGFIYRYEKQISYKDFTKLIRKQIDVNVEIGDKSFVFTPSKKTTNSLYQIDRIVLQMLETK